MKRGRLKAIAVLSSAAVLFALAPDPAAADGNANLHLFKFVDPQQLSINPNIGVTLTVDKASAIPGDKLTYTSVVTNPTAGFGMGGYFNAQSTASADATIQYYWDELEYCGSGFDCGNGMSNLHWTPVATFEKVQSGYVPVGPPRLHSGLTLAVQPVNRSGVTYPASGDLVLGTVIKPKATATWNYLAKVTLAPTVLAVLADPSRATYIRNVLHLEMTVRNSTAAQPATDPELFTSPFTSTTNPGAIRGVTVTFTLPDGSTAVVGPSQVPGFVVLSPGASATATSSYTVPAPGPLATGESESSYKSRLGTADAAVLTTSALAAGGGFSGTVFATAPTVSTSEHVPIVTITKTGPATTIAGTTEPNGLALSNTGHAPASALAVDDSVPSGAHGSVSGVPTTPLAAGASAGASAAFQVPIDQADGPLTDTATVTWKDVNGNSYGPLSSAFMTTVRNPLIGATLTLLPTTAGPNSAGTMQQLTATLADRDGNLLAGKTVTLSITGANPATLTVTTGPGGDATFSYIGANIGSDVAQATFTAGSLTLPSNTSSISWVSPLTGGRLTLAPITAGPNPVGSTQQLTANLVDRDGNLLSGRSITLSITGANPGTFTATTGADGNATFTYTGAKGGDDVAQATVTDGFVTLTSNTSTIAWGVPLQPVTTGVVTGNFFQNPNNSCTIDFGPSNTAVFNQQFPDILFNPPTNAVPHNISGVGTFTRPFTDLTVDVNGNYNGQIVAQGNGYQAGIFNPNQPSTGLDNFYAEFTGTFTVNTPGDLSFTVLHDDAYILGVGGGASRVNGDFEGNPPASTPFNGYPVVAGFNGGVSGGSHSGTDTIHFPAAGTYPYELDYTECGGGELFLVLETAKFVAQTSPISIYVGYADGLRPAGSIFPFPWNGSANVTFEGCLRVNCPFDGGAIRIDNSGSTPVTVDSVTVDIAPAPGVSYCPGTTHYDIWPHGDVVQPGQILILAPEDGGDAGCGPATTFDTSDTSFYCGPNTGVIPVVNVSINGVVTTYQDSSQVLNTGGRDLACDRNESTSWQRVGGGGTAINVPLPPGASLDISPFKVADAIVGQDQKLTVSAMDGAGNPVANLPITLQVFGVNAQTLNATTVSTGLATFHYVGYSAGADTIQATAFVGGLRELSNVGSVTWTNPGGGSGGTGPPPSITSPSPQDGSVVTKPVSVSATIAPPAGQTIASWRVYYQALDPGPIVVFGSGSGTPPDPLATFDPTVLPNDTYGITVEATSSGGGIQDVTTTVTVLGNLKPGRFTAEYQDLLVPVNGMSMEVRRSYDSIDKSQGDFGIGWRVSIVSFRVAPNHLLGGDSWTMYNKQCFFGLCLTGYKTSAPRFVSVVFPDGHTELFDFTPLGGTNVFWDCTPQFTAQGAQGTTSTLEPLDDTACSYTGDGNLYGSNGVYNPQRFRLTTRDGRIFILDRRSGLVSESDLHGNTLTIDAAGVHSTGGGSIAFERDANGRITKVTGPAGETLTYTYSAAGDLASVTDASGAVTTFAYNATHDLSAANGPGGRPLMSATYDTSGRISSITDANGNTVQIANDVAGQQEVITDATGETFVDTLSDRGDLLSQSEVGDGHANTYTYTYDSLGRQLSATDPLGNTSRQTYDSAGDLLTSTDPKGRRSTMTYGTRGELLTFTDPAGGTTTYTWDAALNLVSVKDLTGATTNYTYDSSGNRTSDTDPLGAVTSYTYDSAGRLLTQTDPIGRVTTYTYDSEGRLLTKTDAAGNRTALVYDTAGLLLSSTDPTGAVTKYVHDAQRRVTSVTDPLGRVTAYTYDNDGRVTSKTDPAGGRTTYTYDAAGRELTETDPTGAVLTFAYDGHGRQVKLTDAVGRVTQRAYDDAGDLVSMTNAAGGATHYSYGVDGLKTGETDPLGRSTSYSYDVLGRLTAQTDPLGNTTTYAYDGMGRQTSVRDPLGAVTSYAYDAAGRRTKETDPTGAVTSYAYDLAGQQTSITDPTGRTTTFAYDAAGNLASTTDAAGHTTSYAYDGAGRQTRVVTPLGRVTTSVYDAAGQLTSITDPLGNVTSYTYDAAGRRATATSPRGAVTRTAYDGDGRPTRITDPLGGVVSISYDAAGERSSITDPDGHVTTFTYAPLGGIASRTYPWGGTQTFTYDAAGQATSETNARGTTATRTYDAGGNLTGLAVTGGGFTQTFDAGHRRTSFTDATGKTTFTYDAAGRPTSVAAPAGTISYTYDAAGRRASETLPGGKSIAYTYDAAGLVANTTDWSGATVAYTHDADGELTSIARLGSTTAMTYDAAGRVASTVLTNAGGAIDTFTYTYDADGNRTSMTSNAGTESYTIDFDNRLTLVHYGDGSTASYSYDAAGNQTSSVTGGTTTSYSYDSGGRLTAAGGAAVTSDADGNVIAKGGDTFAYDWAGRLTSATVAGVPNTYTYNADGERVAATRGPAATSFLIDPFSDLPQVVGDGSNQYVRDPSGQLLEWRNQTSGTPTAPLADALGSVRYLTDGSGSVSGSAAYGAFGDVRSQNGAASPFGFAGEQSDPTGLDYLRARYYDPSLGRFLSPDTLDVSGPGSTGYNRYAYAGDDPTTLTDPSGHQVTLERVLLTLFVGVTGSVLIYLVWWNFYWTLMHTCVFNGRCFVAPAVGGAGDAVIGRPWTRTPGKPIDKQAIRDLIKAVAAACAAAGTYGAVVGGFAQDNPCNLLPVDVFFVGIDLKEISDHDLKGIQMHPEWEVLEKAPNPRTTTTRDWYNSQDECSKTTRSEAGPGLACHEFPYFKTAEGGPAGVGNFGAFLELLDSRKNSIQGGLLGAFYTRCQIPDGDTFYVRGGPVTWGVCKHRW